MTGKTVAIRGVNFSNKGDEAMLKTALAEMSRRLPDEWNLGFLTPSLGTPDFILDVSGFAFSSYLHWGSKAIERAVHFRATVPQATWYFLPQSAGPFEGVEQPSRELFRNAIVYARDKVSFQHLFTLNDNQTHFETRSAPDITWGFEADVARGRHLLDELGLRSDQPIIGVSPNMRVYERDPQYLDRLRRYIVIAERLAQVVVLPHEITEKRWDDRWICRQLGKPSLLGKHSAEEIRGTIACLDLLIGSRFHALLGALSYGVPVYAIGWAAKYEELLGEFELGRYVVKEDAEPDEAHILAIWEEREALRDPILKQAEAYKQAVSQMFDSLAQEILSAQEDKWRVLQTPLHRGIGENREASASYFNLRRNLHRLEKGIASSLQSESRRPFALDYIEETLAIWDELADGTAIDDDTKVWAWATLDHYFELQPLSPFRPRYQLIRERFGGSALSRRVYRASERPVADVTLADLATLFKRRRSVRLYEDRTPERELIQNCLELAMQAPSACNRQSFRFQYYDDQSMVRRIAKIPFGARDMKLPALMVMIGCYEGYFDARDIKCPIIDASLAAMQFMLALESVGLSSVPINFPELPEFNSQARELCGLRDSEMVVMLMGIGYPDPDGFIATSPKRTVGDVLAINPHETAKLKSMVGQGT